MPSSNFLAISCGARHLCSVHLKMNPSGRCELLDYQVDLVDFSSNDPLLWLKATSSHLDSVALRFGNDMPAGFVIPGHVALSKYLKIPQVASGKRDKIVAFEARQNIPYPIAEVTWNHAVVEEDSLDFEVLIGATRTEIVDTIARYARDSEIDLRCIEPSNAALINGFRYNYADQDGCSMLLSIGAKSTDIIFVEKGRYHSRNVPFGGQGLSVDIAESLNVPMSEGERVKLSAIAGEALSTEEFSAFEAAQRGFFNRLVTEITRTSAVVRRQGFAFEPSSCFLTGGGAQLPELMNLLEARLRYPVRNYEPFRKIDVSDERIQGTLESDAHFLSDVVGLGVGRFLPDSISLDLTPRSIVWQRKFRRQQPFFLLAGLVACGAIGLPIFNAALEIRTYEQELQNLDVQVSPLSRLNQQIFERSAEIRRLKEAIEKSATLAETRLSWMVLLNDLQDRLLQVEDVWLDKLRLDRPEPLAPTGNGRVRVQSTDTKTRLRLQGRLIDVYNPVSSVSPDSYERVKALLENFRGSEFVESLEDERFDYSVPGILAFDFTLVIDEEVSL
ncbi:pilus assembly protein PilM [Pelagicoccus sp. SDUM812003]|uniref:pilus assembly protein PilM n=1 Tax=Pelagicoccus sp. SDUM812003 TaxID=3041267 RepID=UPI0028100493|nr:pilus assembly protein PilM [Pelagicoccus sp. SDUM812003]MDQ8204474.1 pilus assembly protein PilM [Pelagicoccus sp. SDUM812003]